MNTSVLRLIGIVSGFFVLVWAFKVSSNEKKVVTSASSSPSKAPQKVETTSSGLQYIVLKEGKGTSPTQGQTVQVHYTGWLSKGLDAKGLPIKGKKFDSSRDRGKLFSFPIGMGRVIKGWDEGVSQMKPGERRLFIIPPQLGYGARSVGNGLIPANSTLLFDVKFFSSK